MEQVKDLNFIVEQAKPCNAAGWKIKEAESSKRVWKNYCHGSKQQQSLDLGFVLTFPITDKPLGFAHRDKTLNNKKNADKTT